MKLTFDSLRSQSPALSAFRYTPPPAFFNTSHLRPDASKFPHGRAIWRHAVPDVFAMWRGDEYALALSFSK